MKQPAKHPFIYNSLTSISGSGTLPLDTERVSEHGGYYKTGYNFRREMGGGIVRIYFAEFLNNSSFSKVSIHFSIFFLDKTQFI
jgi:hypothetical protein